MLVSPTVSKAMYDANNSCKVGPTWTFSRTRMNKPYCHVWHEPINVMENYPERWRHSGRERIKRRLELHVLS